MWSNQVCLNAHNNPSPAYVSTARVVAQSSPSSCQSLVRENHQSTDARKQTKFSLLLITTPHLVSTPDPKYTPIRSTHTRELLITQRKNQCILPSTIRRKWISTRALAEHDVGGHSIWLCQSRERKWLNGVNRSAGNNISSRHKI